MARRIGIQRQRIDNVGLKLSKLKQTELSRTVKNFNRRIDAAAKRGIDKSILPSKVKVSEIKREVKTVAELNRLIKKLNKATYKTLIPVKSKSITKWQLDIEKQEAQLLKRKERAKKLKEASFSITGRRFPTQRDWLIKNIGILDEDQAEEMLSKVENWLQGKNLERSEQWRQNYIRTLDDNIKASLSSGDSLSADSLETLKERIEKADLIDFLIGQLSNSGQLAIGYLIASPPVQGITGSQMEEQASAYQTLIQAWNKYI